MSRRWIIALLPVTTVLAALAAGRVVVGDFFSGSLEGWESKRFHGETDYRLAHDGQVTALRAHSEGTASGLYRQVEVDLSRTPWLNWSWKVENTLDGLDERTRDGDDYSARVYVVFSGGLLFWRTKAVNYVWSGNQPVGSQWKSAFTANAGMIAVGTAGENVGRWVRERRNVRDDYKSLFGEYPDGADAVAIMTDTDNSGREATAWYGDIYFSGDEP